MHARVVLKVSCLERCPQFRGVLIEREVQLCYDTYLIDQFRDGNEWFGSSRRTD